MLPCSTQGSFDKIKNMYSYQVIAQEYFKMQVVAKKINIKGYGKSNIFKLLSQKNILNNN